MSKILSNIITFSMALILSKVIGTATTFCIARLLLPAQYGIWMTLMLIVSYSTILCFGTVETLVKQVPFFVGKKDDFMIRRTDGGVLASIYFSAGILIFSSLVILIINSFFNRIPFHQYIQIMLITAGIALFSCFFYYRLTAFSQFKEVSFLNSSRAFITFVLVIGLGWKWNLFGMVIGALLTEITMLLLSIRLNRILNRPISLIFDRKLFWDLIKIGFPITLVWWGYVVMTSLDRVISMSMLGKVFTGYYTLGTSIVSVLILVPMAISQVLYPQVNEEVGKKTSNLSLSKIVVFPTQAMSLIVPTVLGVLFIITPIIYKYIFPKYLYGIHSAQILLCGAFFVCPLKNGVNYLVALDKQFEVFKYVLISLATNVVLTITAIKMSLNIEGVALATSFGSLLLTTLIWKSVYKNLGFSFSEQMNQIFQLYLPMVLMTIILMIIIFIKQYSSLNSIIEISLSILLFLTSYAISIYATPFLRNWAILIFQKVSPKRNTLIL